MKKFSCLLLLTMLTVLLTGCKKEDLQTQDKMDGQTEQTVTFTDDLGREVTVNQPKRVAALLGSYADIWYLAGGEICASADDAWDDFDLPLTDEVVNLGMTKELSLEKLLEADPDFVLASSNTKGNVEWMETLEAAGITTAYFGVSDFEDYLRVLKYCTDITGREDLYQKNGLDLKGEIEAVIEKSKERVEEAGNAPTVLSLRASSTYIRAKNSHDNVLGEMLKALGCINIADQDDSLLENLSVEHIVLQDPDYIFIVQQGDDEEGTRTNMEHFIADNPTWSELTAVKENRVYFMEKPLYSLKPNARWGEAYEKLERILANEEEQD
ncbi:MAG: ABC transporter substrate-binding protein [Roseburia sp.]